MKNGDLTPRERDVLLLAAEGLADKEIAERLGVGRGTVATYWLRLRERTGAVNRTQAVAMEMLRVFRESEAERARTTEMYRSLIDSLEDFAVFLMDADRTILTWNPGVRKILGYEEAEWIGQKGDILFTPEDREAGVPDREQETALRGGGALDDRDHLRRDGSRFLAAGVMTAVRGPDGEMRCLSKLLRDMTHWQRRP